MRIHVGTKRNIINQPYRIIPTALVISMQSHNTISSTHMDNNNANLYQGLIQINK